MNQVKLAAVIEIVKNAGLKDANVIESFIIAQGKAVTVPMIEEGLDQLFVGYQKKMPKATKINLFSRALEMDIDEIAATEEESAADESSVVEVCVECKIAPAVNYELCNACRTKVEAEIKARKQSAADESSVAEENTKEETQVKENKTMSELEQIKYQNQKAMDASKVLKNQVQLKGTKSEYVNPVKVKVDAQIGEAISRYFSNLGEYRVEVLRVVPLTNDRFNRVGYMDVKFPVEYAMTWLWNEQEKKREWFEFTDFNYNQMVRREKWSLPYSPAGMVHNMELGSGIVRLGIREDVTGDVYVRLPMDKMKDGGFMDVFRTSNIQWGRPNSSNNGNVEAALTAALRFYWKELKMENPANRNEFDASCMNCRNLQWFGMKDGVDDDLNAENPKNTRILNQPVVEELANVGSHITQAYCTKRKFFVDAEAVEMINGLTSQERTYYNIEVLDPETGEIRLEQRFQGRDEIIVAGKPIKVRDVRVESTRELCRTCPFYHKNAYKGESQIGSEIVEAREKLASKAKTETERQAAYNAKVYTNDYWTTRARAGRQSFETLVDKGNGAQWMIGFPAQVAEDMSHVMDIRVAGIGVNVYFGDELMGSMADEDFAFLPGVESFNEKEAAFNKLIGMIYYAAFNRDKMSRAKFEEVTELIYVVGRPEGLTEKEVDRWNNAVHWFEESLNWAAERVAAANRPDFAVKFYAGIDGYMKAKGLTKAPDLQAAGVKEIHIEDVLSETMFRVAEGGLRDGYEHMFEEFGLEKGYEDLEPKDFVRFLDEGAIEYVLDSLVTGSEFVIVGGKKDYELDDEEKFAQDFYGVKDRYSAIDVLSDAGLVTGTLQLMLQRQINSLLYGVNRAGDKVEEFSALNVCEDALYYIAEHAGLLKK